jgi:uncharacterized membrane protein
MKNFSINAAFSFAWQRYKEHWWLLSSSYAIVLVLSCLFSALEQQARGYMLLPAVVGLLNAVVSVVLGIGILVIVFKVARGERADYNDLLNRTEVFFKYFGTQILFGIMIGATIISGVLLTLILFFFSKTGSLTESFSHPIATSAIVAIGLIGLAVLIVIGAIIAAFYFNQYAVVDRQVGPVEALSVSKNLTAGVRWKVLAFILIAGIVSVIGIIGFFVGLLVTLPLSALATVYVYDQLWRQTYQPDEIVSPDQDDASTNELHD